MPLFSKQDAHLPLLTHVFQVDPNNPEEIAGFYAAQGEEYHGTQGEYDNASSWLLITRGVMSELQHFGGITLLTVAAFNGWVEREKPSLSVDFDESAIPEFPDAKQYIDDWNSGELFTRKYGETGMPSEDHQRQSWAVNTVVPANQLIVQGRHNIEHRVQRELWEIIRLAGVGEKPLGRCEICDYVFQVNRENQRYCSRRCANTDWARRNKQTKQLK